MARSIEETRKAKREFMARKRAADLEGARAYARDFHHRNRDRNLATMKAYQGRRFFWMRSFKLKGITARDLASIWRRQRGLCALTGRKLDRSAQIDHKLPKARGGTDELGNLQWLCKEVNLAKRALTDEEFTALCGEVVARSERVAND
jgi:hypothetical protein